MAKRARVAPAAAENSFDSFFLRDWRPYAIILGVVFALYCRVVGFGYAFLDDNALIMDNARFLGDWSSLAAAFKQDVFHVLHSASAYYRPLFMVSLIVDAHWAGTWAGGYHASNLGIHAAAGCVLFSLLKRMRYAPRAALFCALVFAVSPVLTQAVGLVPTRDDSLLGIFVLLSFGAFVSLSREGSPRHAVAHLLFFALALFTKETAVVLAPLCLLYHVLVCRRSMTVGPLGTVVIGWSLLGAVWFMMRKAALLNPLGVPAFEMARSILLNWPAFIQFIGKIVLPFNLSVLPLMQDTTLVYGIIALILLIFALLAAKSVRWAYAAFGAAWFLFFLAPSMTLHSTTFSDVMMEKRVYVPIVGFFFILLETPLAEFLDKGGRRTLWAASTLLAAYAALAFRHASHFKGPMEFWGNAVETSPDSPLAHRNLGAMHHLAGELAIAEAQYREALRLNPTEPMVHNNLALILAGRGQLAEAEEAYRLELKFNPDYDRALLNYGLLCFRQGRIAETEALWKRAVEVNPDFTEAREDLAKLALLPKSDRR